MVNSIPTQNKIIYISNVLLKTRETSIIRKLDNISQTIHSQVSIKVNISRKQIDKELNKGIREKV